MLSGVLIIMLILNVLVIWAALGYLSNNGKTIGQKELADAMMDYLYCKYRDENCDPNAMEHDDEDSYVITHIYQDLDFRDLAAFIIKLKEGGRL